MGAMTFQLNDAAPAGGPPVWVHISENADGTLAFSVFQRGDAASIDGLFFDIKNEGLIGTLTIASAVAPVAVQQGDDSVVDLGDDVNMYGFRGSNGSNPGIPGFQGNGYDVGIRLGEGITSYEFTLGSTQRPITLQEMSGVDFAVRLEGTVPGGYLECYAKLGEHTSRAITAESDAASIDENCAITGDVLANDRMGLPSTDVLSVIGWSGGAVGHASVLAGAAGATLTLNRDGTYVLDASAADALSEGEHLQYVFSYHGASRNEPTSWSVDRATLSVTVNGVNDGPVANDDNIAAIAEDQMATGNVLGNDSDIDRLDTTSVTAVNGISDGAAADLDINAGSIKVALASGAIVTVNADGTFSYGTNHAFDSLNDGQSAADSFIYTLSDNHGATDTATVSLSINGVTPPVVDPVLEFLFNHGTKKNDHGFFPQDDDKDNAADGFTDNDTLQIAGYGNLNSITVYHGDFGLGDPDIEDTRFVLSIGGNPHGPRTEDVGYLVDFSGLDADQIEVTGNFDEDHIFFV